MSKRILGIDPGSRYTGFGIVDLDGNHSRHVDHGVITIHGDDIAGRLGCIFAAIERIVGQHNPAEAAVEKVFMNSNADSALKLGQARGAAISALARGAVEVFEYTPNEIKRAIVGRGHAAKIQVQHMVKVLLCLQHPPEEDAADALAVALCHGHRREGLRRTGGIEAARRGRAR